MKSLKLFAAALVLLAAPYAALADPAPKYVTDISEMERASWRIACAFKAYDCSRLPAPQVWYIDMQGTHGRYFFGAPGIEVSTKLLGQSFSGLVMVHEMVHYIQYAQRREHSYPSVYDNRCVRESEAFNIAAAAAYSMGINDIRLASWPQMAGAYGCSFSFDRFQR
jgi:hypothetical protein